MKIQISAIAIVFLSFSFSIDAQPYPQIDTAFAWASGQSSSEFVIVRTLIDHQGNYLVAGMFKDNFDADPGPGFSLAYNNSSRSVPYLQKLSPTGQLLWVRTWPENSFNWLRSMTVDSNNDIYLGGYFHDEQFDADPVGVQYLNVQDSITGFDIESSFIIKLNPQGQLLWSQAFEGATVGYKSVLVNNGKVYVGGTFQHALDTVIFSTSASHVFTGGHLMHDNFLAILDANSGYKKKLVYYQGTARGYLTGLDVFPNGDILIGGEYGDGSIDFDPDTAVDRLNTRTRIDKRGYLLRLDSNLIYKNHAFWQGPTTNYPAELNIVGQNEIWVGGHFNDTLIDLDPGPGFISPSSKVGNRRGSFYLRLDSNFSAQKVYYHLHRRTSSLPNSRNPQMLVVGNDIFVGGTFQNYLYVYPNDPSTQRINLRFNSNQPYTQRSFYLAKINAQDSIEYIYHPQIYVGDTNNEEVSQMLWDGSQIVLTGIFKGEMQIDPGPDSSALQAGSGWANFLIKLKDCTEGSVPTVNRSFTACDSFMVADTSFTSHGWHQLAHPLQGRAGCDSVIANDFIFVFNDRPQVTNHTTYLKASFQDTTMMLKWIDCSTGSLVQNGGTRFYPRQPGDYALRYEHPLIPACADTTPCENIAQINLPEVHQQTWSFYPNPAREIINLQWGEIEIEQMRVLDMRGRVLSEHGQVDQINIKRLPQGSYLLEVESDKGKLSKRFLKL